MNQKKQLDCRLRVILIIAGTVSLSLGIVGIVLPVLPTTPFLLLAAFCYARSSQQFYNWLLGNRYLGIYIRNYLEKRGVRLKVKIFTIAWLWLTISASVVLISPNIIVQVILVIIAAGVTAHVLSFKTLK
jgi:uncharacterized membrane protein YbaN (DUF454 family)